MILDLKRFTTKELCLQLEQAGADKGFKQLQFDNGAYVSTLIEYLDNNPGLVETMANWIEENDRELGHFPEDEDDEDFEDDRRENEL